MSWAMATVAVLRWLGRQLAAILGALILFLGIIVFGFWGVLAFDGGAGSVVVLSLAIAGIVALIAWETRAWWWRPRS